MIILYNPKENVRLRAPYIPFSLLTLATTLKTNNIESAIIDARVNKNARKRLDKLLQKEPLAFGMTLMTGSMIDDALNTARYVKRLKPDIKIIAGGVHPSLLPIQTNENSAIDIVVIGPGEVPIVSIINNLKQGKSLATIPNITFKQNDQIIATERTPVNAEAGCSASIDYHFLDLTQYIKTESCGKRCLDYLSSRGCPHICSYCSIAQVWDKKMHIYSSSIMINDIERFIAQYNIDSIHFVDDNFFVNQSRVEAFCDEIIKRDIAIKFWATCRIDYFARYSEAFLKKLRRAGFLTLNFGAESGSQYILDKIKKQITPDMILETVNRCNTYGFRGQFSFMMAFPFERPEDLKKTMDLIDKIYSINHDFDCQLFPFIPFPETALTVECEQNGFSKPLTLEEWKNFEFGQIAMPWLSEKQKKKIDTLTTLAWFGFTSETAIKLGGVKGRIYRLFGAIARFRWRLKFFAFPIEWKLINLIARKS